MTEEAARKRPSSRASTTRWTILSVVLVVVAVVYTVWRPRPWEQAGPGMEPALTDGDHFLSLYLTPRLGDVVVLLLPGDGSTVVKRIVGVAGDTIELREGRLFRNGRAVTGATRPAGGGLLCAPEALGGERWSVVHADSIFAGDSSGPTHVPAGHVFVLGDHRDRSNDSRFFGTVPLHDVLGRVAWTYWRATPHVRCP